MPKGDRYNDLPAYNGVFTPNTRAELNTERQIVNDLKDRVPDIEAQLDKVKGGGTAMLFDHCVNGFPGTVGLMISQPPKAIGGA